SLVTGGRGVGVSPPIRSVTSIPTAGSPAARTSRPLTDRIVGCGGGSCFPRFSSPRFGGIFMDPPDRLRGEDILSSFRKRRRRRAGPSDGELGVDSHRWVSSPHSRRT